MKRSALESAVMETKRCLLRTAIRDRQRRIICWKNVLMAAVLMALSLANYSRTQSPWLP
jgi:hypothetical protein